MSEMLVRKKRVPWGHLILFGWMPSLLKVITYRLLLGYKIGKGVKIAFGGVIVGREVSLGDHAEIGFLAVVVGRHISIGRHSSVGTMSYVACERIEIGEDARIREQVYVGGPQLPESRFALGDRTIVLQMAFINPTKPVVIGHDTGIGGHCLIFTHSAWLNVLDGYPVTYQGVTLGNSVWLPWRIFVMPGTTIGDGTVIGANSLVQGTIPPRSLAVGSPAKIIRENWPEALGPDKRAAKIKDMISEFDRYVEYDDITIDRGAPYRSYRRGNTVWRLAWIGAVGTVPADPVRGDTILTEAALSEADRTSLRGKGVHWLDLGGKTRSRDGSPLTEELHTFLGRYGIRLVRD
jgi:acetyltransferase-like isoleucine patch superfamily enzyme